MILGKTATTEFREPGPGRGQETRATFSRSPGVSSSGSAAAVADCMAPVALGSQTGGSMIMPAASCGVVGYKASLDGIDRGGLRHLRPSLDTIGVFARSVADIALVRAAMSAAPPIPLDGTPPPRIAVCRAPHWEEAEPATVAAVDDAAAAMERAGATLADIVLPPAFDAAEDAFTTITAVEGGRSLAYEIAHHRDRLNAWIGGQAALGERSTEADYAAACETAARCREAMMQVFERFDVILTASAPGEPTADLTGIQKSSFKPDLDADARTVHQPSRVQRPRRAPGRRPTGRRRRRRRPADPFRGLGLARDRGALAHRRPVPPAQRAQATLRFIRYAIVKCSAQNWRPGWTVLPQICSPKRPGSSICQRHIQGLASGIGVTG